ncbi:MAG: cytochrome c biogenesis protein CcsA [Oceanospirillaceae bacterium]|nr:cytochrome c biogenesis protein CcsA [Oceanospirillaceae bacterium]
MFSVLILTSALLYLLSAGAQYLLLIEHNSWISTAKLKAAKPLGALAIISHTFLLQQSLQLEHGISLSIFTTGSLVSWLVALVLVISSMRQQVENLFIAVFPMAALLILCDGFFTIAAPKPYESGLISHILLSILSYSIFTLAAFQAVLLHQQNKALKHNISGPLLNSLPPLQTMERLLFEMLWTGFALLSVSLVTGIIFVNDIFDQHLAHKIFLSFISWLIFATLLTGRVFWGWRGNKAIRWTIGGFISLMLGFFGSKLVLEILL